MATEVIAAGRREGRQAKTGLFIQNLCETEHPGDNEIVGILSLNPEGVLGFVRDGPSENSNKFPLGAITPKRPRQG